MAKSIKSEIWWEIDNHDGSTVNEIYGRKRTSRAKLKPANKKERL